MSKADPFSTALVSRWVRSLEQLYVRAHRKLPWRESHDPYRIWISEVMLQQTQVAAVIPYYENFLKLFPTVKALAKAPEERVLTAWSGLGYYSRARNLRKGAQYLLETHDGDFPRTREEILEVPGIGPYTAGAILSIAFDLRVPIVDGNVQRVFARFYGEGGELHEKKTQTFFWLAAKHWVDVAASARNLNQALMELGALVCTKALPKCDRCPLQKGCVAFAKNLQTELPRKKRRTAPIDLWWAPIYLEAGEYVYLRQNPKGEWWSDMWDFPRCEASDEHAMKKLVVSKIAELDSKKSVSLGQYRHTVTHHRIHARPVCVSYDKRRPVRGIPGEWVKKSQLPKLPLSSLAKKVLRSRQAEIADDDVLK